MFDVLLLLTALTGQSDADPLAPAREGKVQCYKPDVGKKTCMAISAFLPQADGSWVNKATALLDPAQGITMTTNSVVQATPTGVCGTVTRDDILKGSLTMGGGELPAEQGKPILEMVATAIEGMGMIGKPSCSAFAPDGDALKSTVTIDGVAKPEFSQRVIWVSPDEGYKVGS